VDLGEAEWFEGTNEFTELADIGEGLLMPSPNQGFAAVGFEKEYLKRINRDARPILQVKQDAIFDNHHDPSVGLPVDSAVNRSLGRLNGCLSGGSVADCFASRTAPSTP
jgi:hypothetical protein